MGNSEEKCLRNFRIASLNFSGDILSPFEFFIISQGSLGSAQDKIGRIFKEKLEKLFKDLSEQPQFRKSFQISIKTIDKHFKKSEKHVRYTPLYYKKCGITQQGKFQEQGQFNKRWNKHWEKWYIDGGKDLLRDIAPRIEKQDSQKNPKTHMRYFDFLIYKSILIYLYEMSLDNVINKQSTTKYYKFLQDCFNLPFLSSQKKAEMVFEFLNEYSIAVMFLQDTNEALYKYIENRTSKYRIIRASCLSKMNKVKIENFREKMLSEQWFPDENKESHIQEKLWSVIDQEYQQYYSAIIINQERLSNKATPMKRNTIFNYILNDDGLSELEKKKFMMWRNTAVFSTDDFIFVSIHSTVAVVDQMADNLYYIRQRFPKKYIVMGGTIKGFQNYLYRINKAYQKQRDNISLKRHFILLTDFHIYPNNILSNSLEVKIIESGQAKGSFQVSLQIANKNQEIKQSFTNKTLYNIQKKKDFNENRTKREKMMLPPNTKQLKIVDRDKYIATTMKKRTYLQAQLAKANESVNQCTSFIIYDKRLTGDSGFYKFKEGVCQIHTSKFDFNRFNNRKYEERDVFIPSNSHPFDHFVILTTIETPVKKGNNNQKKHNLETYTDTKGASKQYRYYDDSSSSEDQESVKQHINRKQRF